MESAINNWHCEVLAGKEVEFKYFDQVYRGRVTTYGLDWFKLDTFPLHFSCDDIEAMRVEGFTLEPQGGDECAATPSFGGCMNCGCG